MSQIFTGDRALDLVWLQGQVTEVSRDRDTIQIVDDNRGEEEGVLVSACSKVPGNSDTLSKGHYCQVLGQLDRGASPHIRVKAVKVVNLSKANPNVEVLRATWLDEVSELEKIRSKI